MCNALSSLHRGRAWEVRLITQALVRRKELLAFAENPEKQPILLKHLNRAIASVTDHLATAGDSAMAADTGAIRNLALSILKSLSETEPVALAALKGEIETELAFARPNRHAVQRTASLLIGAMLRDAAAGPGRGRVYDVNWLNEIAGPGVRSDKSFDRDEGLGCDEAVARALPPTWKSDHLADRVRLQPLLKQFLIARESLFILLGKAGTGKSWAIAGWTANDLAHGIRLLVSASTLDVAETLDGMVATALSPFSGSLLQDQEFLDRFRAAATGRGEIPPVVVIDDLQASPGTAELLRGRLSRLARRARETGVKLLLTCQTETWELFQLWRSLPSGEIFSLDPMTSEDNRKLSFRLEDFSPDERSDAIVRRLSSPKGKQASLQLRAPGLTPLRNPYLLTLYLNQHGQNLGSATAAPDPVVVDELLRERVRNQLEQAAAILGTSSEPVHAALASLVSRIWAKRSVPVMHADAVQSVSAHLPDQGKQALDALQRVGLITIQGGVRLAEEPVANHLLANYVAEQGERGGDVCSLILLDRDKEIATSLIRSAPDPVFLADQLVRRDKGWSIPVCAGLSQCSPGDVRVVAMLAGLARPIEEGVANFDECRSLGLLAARGGGAWPRVLRMYLSEHSHERRQGEIALGAALEVVPELVGEAIRKRLALEGERGSGKRDRDRLRRLTDAFSPLHQIVHRAAANVARALLPEAYRLVPDQQSVDRERLLDAIDDIRGRVAQFGDEPDVAALRAELASPDPEIRFRAAGALRPLAFESPNQIKGAVLESLRLETSPHVLSRVLWMAPRVVESAPDEFLAAFEDGNALAWQDQLVIGPALVILGTAARVRPKKVMEILPKRLDVCEPFARALVSELLVYAWWCVSETEPSACAQLRSLGEPDLEGIPDPFRIFAFRGAALARLAGLCPAEASVNAIGVQMVHFRGAMLPEYMFVDAGEFFRQHAVHLVRHPEYPRAEEALLDCILAKDATGDELRDNDLQNARYFCAGNSLEILISGWAVCSDPLPGLTRLPRDWEALRAVRKLLEAGRIDPPILAFARRACDDSAKQHTMQAWHERQECLVQLARLGETPQAELLNQRVSMAHSFFAPVSRARGLTSLVDEHPADILTLLDSAIMTHADIPILSDWGHDCRSWQAVLISEVYGRMFEADLLTTDEARRLVEKMLTALRALPFSAQRLGQEALYATLKSWFDGKCEAPPPFENTSVSPIERSHTLALQCLRRAASHGGHEVDGEWIHSFVVDRRGWWETTNWKLENGGLSQGSGLYLIYVFPAVRLALAAVGQHYNLTDPAKSWMDARATGAKAIHDHHSVLVGRDTRAERLELTLADLESHFATMPEDERLWNSCGNLLLRLGRIEEARRRLEFSLHLPSSDGDSRATALYDLACVEARSGRDDVCREMLLEHRRLRPLDAAWMNQDPDLQSVRNAPWFQKLVQNPSASRLPAPPPQAS